MRAADGELVLVARNAERLKRAADELNPLSTAAFDAQDTDRLERFLGELPGQVDHVMVTAGSPSYTPSTTSIWPRPGVTSAGVSR